MDTHEKIVWICCSLSIAGSLLLILIYAFTQKLRQMGAQFVFSQAFCDLILSCALLASPILKDLGLHETKTENATVSTWSCNIIALTVQFSSQASVAWNFMMSVAIYRTVYAATKYQLNSVSLIAHHAYVWFSALLNASILLIIKVYGPSPIGCWISDPPFYIFFVLPLLVYFCGSSAVLVLVITRVKKITTRLSKSSRTEEYAFMVQVVKYIIVFLVMWSVPLAAGFLKMFHIPVSDGVNIVILLSLTLQGFANACVWLSSPKFIKICVDYGKRRSYQYLTDTESEKYINNTPADVKEVKEDKNYNSFVNNTPAAPQS